MRYFYKHIFTSLTVLSALSTLSAATVDFVNNPDEKNLSWWGTGKSETYDIALYIATPEFIGLDITAISFPVVTDEAITDYTIWLSKELNLEDKVNVADIASAPAIIEGETAAISLDTPYRITEEGVYVGISFNVTARETEKQKNPIACLTGIDNYGFYLHTSRTYTRWAERSENIPYSIPVTLTLGGVAENAATLVLPKEVNTGVGIPSRIVSSIVNRGANDINTLTFDYTTTNGIEGSIITELNNPIKAGFNRSSNITIDLPAVETISSGELTLTAIAVNGTENSCKENSAVTTLNVCSHVPVHRPLMEEYTGMGCGWCPRGTIGIEKMRELYGNNFIAVAHHCDDELAIFDENSRPNYAPGQPAAWLDRWRETDPYNGDNTTVTFGIDKVWQEVADKFTPAEIELEWEWTDETKEIIEAKATVNFVKSFENVDFRIAYMVVADGLNKESWYQGNYYTGRRGEFPEEFDFLVEAPQYIFNVTFDDVVILAPFPHGIEDSLPVDIKADEPLYHTFTLSLTNACNLSGENLVQDKAHLSVVAMVLDGTTGTVFNTTRSFNEANGINKFTSDKKTVTSRLYDLTGRKVTTGYKGIAIRVTNFSDGTSETKKIVVK